MPVDAEDRDDESVLESKRAELRDLVREDLATMADWIANEARRRREEVHEQSSYAEMSCDECPRCADRWHATLGDVDAWDLHVEYQYEAHLDWEGDEYHWARNQTWSEFRLERVPSPTDGISSFLGDVAMKLDGLVGEESDDPVPNRGPLLVYRGGGRIAGSYEEERHWGDGDVTRFAASGDTERREDATLEVSRDDNEYELDWKAQSTVEGTVSRPGPDGDRTDRGPVPLYSGFWAMTQSEGKFTSFAPVDEGGNLAAPDLELPRWSIHDCHMVPSESITQDLYRRTDALTARRGRGLSPEADGQYAGQETVTWTLRPATVRGVTPRRPDC